MRLSDSLSLTVCAFCLLLTGTLLCRPGVSCRKCHLKAGEKAGCVGEQGREAGCVGEQGGEAGCVGEQGRGWVGLCIGFDVVGNFRDNVSLIIS